MSKYNSSSNFLTIKIMARTLQKAKKPKKDKKPRSVILTDRNTRLTKSVKGAIDRLGVLQAALAACVAEQLTERMKNEIAEERLNCIPPLHVLQFGKFLIPREYRDALYEYAPFYCTEEVVGSFLGHGTFPSYEDWIEERDYVPSDNEELTDNDD